jgi:tetratricopeptide (TPR) repeat protein
MRFILFFLLLFPVIALADMASALKDWDKRDVPENLKAAISELEKLHEAVPKDRELLLYLSRGHFLMGEYHTEGKEEKMKMFEKSKNYGFQGLEVNPEFAELKNDKIEKAITKINEEGAPLAFWTAASIGKWSKLNGILSSLKYKDQMLALIRRVEELKPDYMYGAVPRFWGGFYALAPGFVGGDMKKSKQNFKKAMEMAPEYVATKVFYAETYLVEEGEKKEFEKVLNEVLAAPEGPKEIQPENRLEKIKAERLLKNIKDLF